MEDDNDDGHQASFNPENFFDSEIDTDSSNHEQDNDDNDNENNAEDHDVHDDMMHVDHDGIVTTDDNVDPEVGGEVSSLGLEVGEEIQDKALRLLSQYRGEDGHSKVSVADAMTVLGDLLEFSDNTAVVKNKMETEKARLEAELGQALQRIEDLEADNVSPTRQE